MKHSGNKRALAWALSLALLLGALPTAALADEIPPPCANHQEHTADCGYIPAKEGQPCKHEQGQHDAGCGWMEGTPETPCDQGCTDTDGDGAIDHSEGCAYAPEVEGTPCKHIAENLHDDTCGYVKAVEGALCGHSCALCVTQDSGTPLAAPLPAAKNGFARGAVAEQFSLAPGGTYWFDLSEEGIPGTANTGNQSTGAVTIPDITLHWVPFTYAGTVNAYKLTSAQATTEESANSSKYDHSLFVADYAVTHTVTWDELNANDNNMIFGKDYASGGVSYTLRAPSVGSYFTGSGENIRGTPNSNEWDAILDKANQGWKDNDTGYIKNWDRMASWGQDTYTSDASYRARRGYNSARYYYYRSSGYRRPGLGFRPVLEVLNPDTLPSDGLKAVTLDLNGGKAGTMATAQGGPVNIVVKSSGYFTAPSEVGLTRPDGNAGTYFKWLGSDGNRYDPGGSVPADVTALTAEWSVQEQFTLAPGETYWFDLSGEEVPGTVNTGNSYGAVTIPDITLHWVPFTYAGTVNAYVLKSRSTEDDAAKSDSQTAANNTTELDNAIGARYDHSLFVADYAVTHSVTWGELNANDKPMIFGTSYASGGVNYTLRAPSVGSDSSGTSNGEDERGTPNSNEWDAILDKANQGWEDDSNGYIKKWSNMGSWGQDTYASIASCRAFRGYHSARIYNYCSSGYRDVRVGFRPVLEVLNPGALGTDGLKAVTLDLSGGKAGTTTTAQAGPVKIVVKSGEDFTAPGNVGLTRPDGNTGTYFKWLGSDGNLYKPGDPVPKTVTTLTAEWADLTGIKAPAAVTGVANGTALANIALPDKAAITTTGGEMQAGVTWDRTTATPAYDPGAKAEQTFTISGTVTLPVGVTNTGGLSLAVTISVTVAAGRSHNSGGSDDDDTPSPTEQAVSKVEKAKPGDTVEVKLPSTGKLPNEILEAAAGKDITLEIDAGKGVTWIINGKDIPKGKLSDLNLKVDARADTIPVTVINAVTGEKKVMQLALSHNGPFDFPLTLRLETGTENAGLFANLYYYNETAKALEYQSTAKIGADGNADIPFAHASSYAVVIDKESHAPADLPFTDVREGDWCYEAVRYVYEKGLMVGVTETAFSPNGPVTRAQVWSVLARLDGADTSGGAPWYAPAQSWAVAEGVSDGANPDAPVTREQLVTMLYRYAQATGRDVSVGEDTNILSYTDAPDVAEWAIPAFQWACGSGVVSGTSDTTLSPQAGATRAQLAVILQRFSNGTV